MDLRNQIKSYITREGVSMSSVVELLSQKYGWSRSVANLSAKLSRGTIRYLEVTQLADVLGYDIVWEKRKETRT